MKKYENITQYLELLKDDEYGAWVYDDITPNASKEPFVMYTDTVKGLIEEVKKTNIDYMLFCETLSKDKNGVQSPENVLAAISAIIKSEEQVKGGGVILKRLQDGTIFTLLRLLKTFDK